MDGAQALEEVDAACCRQKWPGKGAQFIYPLAGSAYGAVVYSPWQMLGFRLNSSFYSSCYIIVSFLSPPDCRPFRTGRPRQDSGVTLLSGCASGDACSARLSVPEQQPS